MQEASKAVVLLSGGLDSATALAIAADQGYACHCLSVDYAQRHAHELQAAIAVAEHLGAQEHRIIRVDLRAIGGSALTDDIEVPKSNDGTPSQVDTTIPPTYVPARNMLFLSAAAGYAEVIGARDIFVGVTAVDYSGYPDCRPAFIQAFENAINLGTKVGVEGCPIRLRTPLIALSKAEIIKEGTKLGVPYELTHSCYDPSAGGLACGRCDSCAIRRAGFAAAGVADPTRYGF